MKIPSSSLRSPLARVRGLGSAKDGTHHWWLERLTSLALIPLSIWFLAELISNLLGASREDVATWLSDYLNTLLMSALIFITFWHTKLGIQVIVEDYVHNEGRKLALLLFKDALIYIFGGLSILAVARLHFIGVA